MNQKQLIRKKKLEEYVRNHNESVRVQVETFKIGCTLCHESFPMGDDMDCDQVRMEAHQKRFHNGQAIQDGQFVGF